MLVRARVLDLGLSSAADHIEFSRAVLSMAERFVKLEFQVVVAVPLPVKLFC